jgi:hypothetical protein
MRAHFWPSFASNRRHDKASGSSWWLLVVCALLLVAPAGAAPLSLSQARHSSAPVEAVFAWLHAESSVSQESRAAVLQVLCERAGLGEVDTARVLSSYEEWSSGNSAFESPSCVDASTCIHAATSLDAPSRRLMLLARTHGEVRHASYDYHVAYLE